MYADKLEKKLAELFPEEFEKCSGFVQHKNLMLTPQFLEDNGIPFSRVIQNAGDLMIVWPRAYHFGYNAGFNQAEAVNFATPQWVEDVKEENIKPCTCDIA